MKDHGCEQKAYALCASIHGPRETTGLAREVEVEIKPKEMFEHTRCNTADSFLGYTSKYSIPQFLKDSSTNTSGTI